jgi:regulatory protein
VSGTISALEPQKKNAGRVNVYLDDVFAFGLEAVDAAYLRVGQALSDTEIAALKTKNQAGRAYERAIRLLARRAHSAVEIRRTLTEAEIPVEFIDATLDRLTEQGYIDDLAFARAWLADRQNFRPISAKALRYELRAKGVADAVIDEALVGFDKTQAAYKALRGQARRIAGLDRRTIFTKLGAFLARRGFDYDTARIAIEQLISESTAADDAGSNDDMTDTTDLTSTNGGDNDADFDQE